MSTPPEIRREFESFVPNEILTIYESLKTLHSWNENQQYNKWFYDNKPNIPSSTVRRWTRAFLGDKAHSTTPRWHLRYRDDSSIIPVQFSDLRNGRWFAERERLYANNRMIRYVNAGDFHVPYNDGALLTLLATVVSEFKPNVFPFFCDWLEQDRFSPHESRPFNANIDTTKPTNKYDEFEELTINMIDLFSSVLPSDCLRINLWGNHEDFILRHLFNIGKQNNDDELSEYMVRKIFQLYSDNNILWLEPDRNLYIPLTKLFWITHGRLSRNPTGGTAKAYMDKVKNAVSVAAQHTHRQETLWSNTPTGEHFYAVSGTLSDRIRSWNRADYRGHNWGFQLILHPIDGWAGSHVEDVRVFYRDGYYICNAMGKEFSEKVTNINETLLIEGDMMYGL